MRAMQGLTKKQRRNSCAMVAERKENRDRTTRGTLKETTKMVDQTGAFLPMRKGKKKKETNNEDMCLEQQQNELTKQKGNKNSSRR